MESKLAAVVSEDIPSCYEIQICMVVVVFDFALDPRLAACVKIRKISIDRRKDANVGPNFIPVYLSERKEESSSLSRRD